MCIAILSALQYAMLCCPQGPAYYADDIMTISQAKVMKVKLFIQKVIYCHIKQWMHE